MKVYRNQGDRTVATLIPKQIVIERSQKCPCTSPLAFVSHIVPANAFYIVPKIGHVTKKPTAYTTKATPPDKVLT
jgi:hypothetical protein